SSGAAELSIEEAKDGIVGRGVLLDIPRLRGVSWLEPGEHVTAAELIAAEWSQRVHVGPGDLLFVRTGHPRRRQELRPGEVAPPRARPPPAPARVPAGRPAAPP